MFLLTKFEMMELVANCDRYVEFKQQKQGSGNGSSIYEPYRASRLSSRNHIFTKWHVATL